MGFRISDLPDSEPVGGSEIIEIEQFGRSRKVQLSNLPSFGLRAELENDGGWVPTKHPLAVYTKRTLQERNGDWLNVKDFGAIGDGSFHPLSERYDTLEEAQEVYPHAVALTDEIDWAAAQAAIAAGESNAAQPGVVVWFPFGTFRMNRTLRIRGNRIVLRGASMHGTRLLRTGDYGWTVHFGADDPTKRRANIGLLDMYMEMDADMTVGGHLYVQDAVACEFRNLHFQDAFQSMVFEGLQGSIIDNTVVKTGTYYPTQRSGGAFCIFRDANNPANETGEVAVSNFNWTRTITSASAVDFGLRIEAGDGIWFSNGHIMGAGTDLRIIPQTETTQLFGMHFSNVWFDQNCQKNVAISGNSTAGFGGFTFSNCQAQGATEKVFEVGASCANLSGITIVGGTYGNVWTATGTRIFDFLAGQQIKISGAEVLNRRTMDATAVAIAIAGDSDQVTLEGLTIGNTVSSPFAIGVNVSASKRVNMHGLHFHNVTQEVNLAAGALRNGSKIGGLSTSRASYHQIAGAATLQVPPIIESFDIITNAVTVTDITDGWDGRTLLVRSNGVSTTFAHNAGAVGSSIRTSTGANVTLTSGQYAILMYHAQSGAWFLK